MENKEGTRVWSMGRIGEGSPERDKSILRVRASFCSTLGPGSKIGGGGQGPTILEVGQ